MQNYFPLVHTNFAVDENGNPSGGESAIYDPDLFPLGGDSPPLPEPLGHIRWQSGVLSQGRNGVIIEDLIEASLQRMRFFQEAAGGKFRCRENSLAITALEEAQNWIRMRQYNRAKQGVQSSYETHQS